MILPFYNKFKEHKINSFLSKFLIYLAFFHFHQNSSQMEFLYLVFFAL